MRASWTEFLIGTFVLFVAIGFAVVGFQRGGWSSNGETYTLNASFRSIEGVSVGTDVRMAGVNVGKVSKIHLNSQNFRAEVEIAVSNDILFPDDSAVLIASEGLLGGNFVELQPGGSPFNFKPDDVILDTQGSVSLLNLLMKFTTSGGVE